MRLWVLLPVLTLALFVFALPACIVLLWDAFAGKNPDWWHEGVPI